MLEIFLIILFVIVLLLLKPLGSKGARGERKVQRKIAKLISVNGDFRVFNNLTLETPDGTTQIDHIILSRSGVFVVETKNLMGWIFGDEKQKQWTQVIYGKKYRFQNPLHQNYKHTKAIQNLLGIKKNQILSVVVFVGDSRFKTKIPSNVLKLRELLPYIRSYTAIIFSNEDIENFSQKLNNPVYSDSSNHKKHIRNLQNNLRNPFCPRCGKTMVLRTARKGNAIGSGFWGCSGYPNCKATKRVA